MVGFCYVLSDLILLRIRRGEGVCLEYWKTNGFLVPLWQVYGGRKTFIFNYKKV